jgi:hypothetical protein
LRVEHDSVLDEITVLPKNKKAFEAFLIIRDSCVNQFTAAAAGTKVPIQGYKLKNYAKSAPSMATEV